MNIAIICDFPFPNGLAATNRILAYGKGLVENKNKVIVYIYRPTEKKKNNFDNIDTTGQINGLNYQYSSKSVYRYTNKLLYSFQLFYGILNLGKILFNNNKNCAIDCIIISNDSPLILYYYYVLTKLFRINKIFFIFDEYPRPIRRFLKEKIPFYKKNLYKVILKNYTGLISMTNDLISFYKDIIKRDMKVHILPVIIDVDWFKNIQIKNKKNNLCYMGNLELAKDNIDNIIKAFSIVNSEQTELYFDIYGLPNEEDKNILLQLIKDLYLEKKVFLKGRIYREKVPTILKESKILVSSQPLTKRASGGFPTKLGEYLIAETPAIFTDVGEISRYVSDEVDCFLVTPCSPVKYAEKIIYVLSNYEKAKIIAKKGREKIINKFGSIQQSKKLSDFIKNA